MQKNEPTSFEVLASQAETQADYESAPQRNLTDSGVLVRVTIAAFTNPGPQLTLTPQLQVRFADGTWVTIWTAAAGLVANGTTTYLLANGNHTNIGALTEVEDIPLPKGEWRLVLGVTGGDASNHATAYADAIYA